MGLSAKQEFDLLNVEEQEAWLAEIQPEDLPYLESWDFHGRPEQQEPEGSWKFWLCTAGRGFGKALALNTPIPTPSGWTDNGDLKDGDEVFDECGQVCRIVKAHDVLLGRKCYRVRFSDGTVIVADSEHLWRTKTGLERKAERRRGEVSLGPVLTTEQIANTVRHGSRGDLNHSIDVAAPLQLPEADLPVDPYVLGAWLGDGSSSESAITMAFENVAPMTAEFAKAGYWFGEPRVKDGALCGTYPIRNGSSPKRDPQTGRVLPNGSLVSKLKSLGVYRHKHVPGTYLRASEEQRWALLAGLMDTDGTANAKCNFCTFDSTSRELAAGAMELIVSLGMKANRRRSRAMLYGRDCGPKYQVTFRPTRQVFRLPQKAARLHLDVGQASRHKHRMIVAVEPTESVPVRCITVDSPSCLYLAGECMIPTHNTRMGAEWVKKIVARHKAEQAKNKTLGAIRIALVARTSADARETMIEGESGILSVYPPEERPLWESSKRQITWTDGPRLIAIANVYYGEEPEKCRGPNPNYAWADETCSWKYLHETWDNLMKMLRKPPARCMITTTPKKLPWLKDLLANDCRLDKGPRNLHVTEGSTYDNADNLDDSALEHMRVSYEGTSLGEQELHGRINWDEIPGALWSSQIIGDTRVKEISPEKIRRKVVAIDPAATSNRKSDLTGIVAVAAGGAPDVNTVRQAVLLGQPHGYVLADRSGKYSPSGWARAALDLLYEIDGDCLVAEINQGGEMVEQCIRSVLKPGEQMPRLKLVHSKVGKRIRAEPVVTLYEQGRFHHVGMLADLESQLTSWVPLDGKPSPDRMDALVHGATELFPSLMSMGEVHGRVGGTVTDWSGGRTAGARGGMTMGNLVRM